MRVCVAMSGGVDSSVAAVLLQEQGYELSGVNLRMFHNEDLGEIDLRSRSILQPAAIHSVIWIGGIHGISRIKEHLVIEDIVVLE